MCFPEMQIGQPRPDLRQLLVEHDNVRVAVSPTRRTLGLGCPAAGDPPAERRAAEGVRGLWRRQRLPAAIESLGLGFRQLIHPGSATLASEAGSSRRCRAARRMTMLTAVTQSGKMKTMPRKYDTLSRSASAI